jgi:hypothetical protein
MKRLLLALLVGGCGHSPVVVPPTPFVVHTEPIPYLGVNGLYGGALPAMTLDMLEGFGPVVMRATVRTRGEAQAALNSVRGYPRLSILLLIDAADLPLVGDIAMLTPSVQWVGVELGNELDLAGLSAAQFGKFVSDGDAVLRAHGFEGDVISGGIYTVTNETLGYLQEAMQSMPADVVLGLHWYGDSGPALQTTVQALAGHRRIAVTEFGMPSQDADQDAQQLAYLQQQLAAFQRLGATYALIYQLVSGPTTSANDNFGLQRYDGTWKPAAALLERKP